MAETDYKVRLMHKLIHKLLKKRGIETLDQLTQEERQTFNTWQSVLSKEKLSTDDLKEFCNSQIAVIEGRWRDMSGEAKKGELIPYHTVYKMLLEVMDSPQKAREALEKQLEQLLN